ncbi:MAG TPA: hypothetical protein VK165_00345 [Azonexus sp.]|nr:hypothetical protein [Azonexus sp.]
MDRAYSSGAAGVAPTAPVAPSIGYPTPGDPAVPTQPSKPGAWWYHMVMEELLAVIAAAALVPAFNTLTQLRDALYVLFGRLGVANVWTKGNRGAEAALPATTGAVTLDLSLSNNWGGTLTGNITLANPSTMPVGQSGVIRIVNGGTPYAVAFGSYWKAAAGTLPSLTATAGATDDLVYYVESATRVVVSALGDAK